MIGIEILRNKISSLTQAAPSSKGNALVGRLMTLEETESVSGADSASCGPGSGSYGMGGAGSTFGQTGGGQFGQTGGSYTMDCTPPKGTQAE